MQHSTILIAGGTGLIGTRLTAMLLEQGHTVRLLSRSPKGEGQYFWNPRAGEIDVAAMQDVDFVVNLAGAGIADKRWTASRKKELVESRVQSANVLRRAIEAMKNRPKAYLSASAVGYYGDSGEALMTEDSAPANGGFMVDCCSLWEAAANQMASIGLRTLTFRIGIVLAREGGALAEVIKPLRFGLGTYFGSGLAWWPWIHRDDVCRAFIWAMEQETISGVFNLVAPFPERGKTLIKQTAVAMKQPTVFLPAPALALRLALGEMAAVVLNSNRVSAEKLTQSGFEFRWPRLDEALRDIFAPQNH